MRPQLALMCVAFLVFSSSLSCQIQLEWNQTITQPGIDHGRAVVVAPGGSVYSAGGKHSVGHQHATFYLEKYSSDGQYIWSTAYSGNDLQDETLESIVLDNYDNIYVAGYYQIGSGGSFLAVLKYDSLGVQQWIKIFPGRDNTSSYTYSAAHLAIDIAIGRVYVAGTYNDRATVSSIDMATGGINWTSTAFPVAANLPQGIVINSYHQIIVAGSTDYSSLTSFAVTTRYDTTGAIVWQRQYSTSGFQIAYANQIIKDYNENIVICGTAMNSTSAKLLVLKYDTAGSLIWERFFVVPSNHGFGEDVALSPTGNYYITGYERIPSPLSENPVIVVYDPLGNLVCADIHQTSGGHIASDEIEISSYGDVYITNGIRILKYSLGAQFQWLYILPVQHEKRSLCLDHSGNLYLSGCFFVNGNDYDFSTSKYNDLTCLEVQENIQVESDIVHVFPNPCSSEISIISTFTENGSLKIFNSSGQEVKYIQIEGSQSIDISFLLPGLYLFRFFEKDFLISSNKVLVN
jgi:hypothetical protein